jgi:hypothetical protein
MVSGLQHTRKEDRTVKLVGLIHSEGIGISILTVFLRAGGLPAYIEALENSIINEYQGWHTGQVNAQVVSGSFSNKHL